MRKGIFTVICCLTLSWASSCSNAPDRSKLTQSIDIELLNPDSLEGDLLIQKQASTIAKIEGRLNNYKVKHILERDSIAGDAAYKLLLPKEAKLNEIEDIILKKGELGFWEVYLAQEIIKPEMIDSIQPYANSPNYLVGVTIVEVLPKKKESLMTTIRRFEKRNMFPPGIYFAFGKAAEIGKTEYCTLYGLKGVGVAKRPKMSGEHIISTKAEQLPYGSAWEVPVKLNTTGAQQFKELTSANVGRPVAIVIDNEVYSAPFVNSPIEGGNLSITGNFTEEEARKMAALLQLGSLPLPVVKKNAK